MCYGGGVAQRAVDWLVAYALGMAFAGKSDEDVLERLVDAADHDAAVLGMARGRVFGVNVGDDVTRRRAFDLLDRAIARLQAS